MHYIVAFFATIFLIQLSVVCMALSLYLYHASNYQRVSGERSEVILKMIRESSGTEVTLVEGQDGTSSAVSSISPGTPGGLKH